MASHDGLAWRMVDVSPAASGLVTGLARGVTAGVAVGGNAVRASLRDWR